MKSALTKGMWVWLLCSIAALLPLRALADQWPMTPGDYWDVTGVQVKDGGALAYANFLASDWKANQEFAKFKGWIKDYKVLANTHPRKGEPDLYLISIYERPPSGAESMKREEEYMAWRKKSQAQMQKEAGNRLEIREISGNEMLQEMKFR